MSKTIAELREELAAARRALEEREHWIRAVDHALTCEDPPNVHKAVDLLAAILAIVNAERAALLAPERPREERG